MFTRRSYSDVELQRRKSLAGFGLFQKNFRNIRPEGWNKHARRKRFPPKKMGVAAIVEENRNPLLFAVVDEFNVGVKMIERINDHTYRQTANGTGSIGGHFRHNLDFALSLLNGIGTGRIDYSCRERNPFIETDRRVAVEMIRDAIRRLEQLTSMVLDRLIFVRSEVDTEMWLPSSVLRELEFIHSHTVHHHALIGEKLAGFGVTAPKEFGVAKSTLEYWRRGRSLEIGGKTCHQN